ncbi:MAG: flagellar biosynthetic protein FliR [Anaerolineae bacterium]|nr:flagellar biosynthetic protein FliR [Anaerolineae bacterium]
MLISVAQAQIFVLALTRVLMILLAMPFLGGNLVPNQVKIGLGVILTMFMLPWQPALPPNADAMPLFGFLVSMIKEIIIGAMAGMAATLVFGIFQVAAKMMEMSAGFSAAQIFNPTLGDTGSAYDQLFMIIIYLYFFAVNGHHIFLIGLQHTFQVLPINSPLDNLINMGTARFMELFTMMITSGIQMALPIVGAILLADITLGLLNKVAPQIQVFFLGINIKIWIGLLGVILTLSFMAPMIRNTFSMMGKMMTKLLGA